MSKLIIIEGVDGSGKTTQTELLIKRFRKNGKKVKTIHFPQHGHEVFGVLIDEYLNNKFGPAGKIDYRLASVLYAVDRFEAKHKIEKWLKQGYLVILDRYTESNFGHQGGKIRNKKKRLEVINWLSDLDYKVFKNPKPDLVLFLDVPVKEVQKLLNKTGKKKDGHEQDFEHLKNSRQAYLDACKKFKHWKTVKCLNKDSHILTKFQISDRIWDIVENV